MYRILLDAMGGDHAPGAAVDGALLALETMPDISMILVGREEAIRPCLEGKTYDKSRLSILPASEVIEMCDVPTQAIRTKKDSSMVKALNLLKEGGADAFVSAGSTGALLTGATLILRRIPGVERPALAATMPTLKEPILLVDCGANVDSKASYLRQFGIMGSVYYSILFDCDQPRVGLLSNGTEEEKGTAIVKEAHQMLKQTDLNFIGNVESREVMSGDIDVLVTDGFEGNVMMKAMEGTAKAIFSMLKGELLSSFRGKMAALLAKKSFKKLKTRMDYSEIGGAPFLGVQGNVVKAHGSSNPRAFMNAIRQARQLAAGEAYPRLKEKILAYKEQEA